MNNPQATPDPVIATGVVCTCPKKNCVRHGKCDECRAYHASQRRPRPPRCERPPGLLKRLFSN